MAVTRSITQKRINKRKIYRQRVKIPLVVNWAELLVEEHLDAKMQTVLKEDFAEKTRTQEFKRKKNYKNIVII